MMAYIYKYMKLRLEFFEEPMLRATPAECLNDPFECQFDSTQIQAVLRHEDNVRGHNGTFNEEDRAYDAQVVAGPLHEDLFELGIVAFTEDYSNLLMWAHYADEHRGMVVEFRNDVSWLADKADFEADGRPVRHVKTAVCNTHELPAQVVYRDSQPDFLLEGDACSGTDYDPPLSGMIKALLLTKGDKWIYEKEHRSVLQLRNCDRLVTRYDDDLARFDHSSIRLRKTSNDECEIDMPADFDAGKNEDVNGDGPRLGLYLRSRYSENPRHLFKVDPEMITGIYFGCRTSKGQVIKAVEKIRSNPLLKHVKLRQAVALTDRFALKFEDIAEPVSKHPAPKPSDSKIMLHGL